MKTVPILALTAVCSLFSVNGQEKNSVTLVKSIPLPDVPGGFNHMSVDAEQQHLFVTATTKKTLEIIDLKAGKPVRTMTGDGPAAALFAPEFNQLYVSHGHNVCVYDGTSFDLVATVSLDSSLDELQYDPDAKRLYVGCMTSNKTAIAVISIPDAKRNGEINLPAKPQGFVVEQKGNRIFANIPGLKQIAVLDRKKQITLPSWGLKDVAGNYPIALDEAKHRLFVGCRRPPELAVLDTDTGKRVANIPISENTDDLAYDPNHKLIYVACGSGVLDVIEQQAPNTYRILQQISTRNGARNSCFSTVSNNFYLAVPQQENQKAEIRVYQAH